MSKPTSFSAITMATIQMTMPIVLRRIPPMVAARFSSSSVGALPRCRFIISTMCVRRTRHKRLASLAATNAANRMAMTRMSDKTNGVRRSTVKKSRSWINICSMGNGSPLRRNSPQQGCLLRSCKRLTLPGAGEQRSAGPADEEIAVEGKREFPESSGQADAFLRLRHPHDVAVPSGVEERDLRQSSIRVREIPRYPLRIPHSGSLPERFALTSSLL